MASRVNKSLLVILTLSSLLLSSNAVPSTRIADFVSAGVPTESPSSQFIDFITSDVPATVPPSPIIDPIPTSNPDSESNSDVNKDSIFGSSLIGTLAAKVAKQIDPEIEKLCADGENPAFCAESISKHLNGPFDPLKALDIEVDATLEKAKNISATIINLLNDPNTDKRAIDALGICKSQYNDMMDAIKESVELLKQQNVVDAYYKFNAVISYKSSCDDAFVESPGVTMPFSHDSETLFQLGGNCLGIMNNLVNNHKF